MSIQKVEYALRDFSYGVITEKEMRKQLRQADGAVFGNPRTMERILGPVPNKPTVWARRLRSQVWRVVALVRYTEYRNITSNI